MNPPAPGLPAAEWLEEFSHAARRLVDEQSTKVNDCVLATKIGSIMLARVGVPHRPTPVHVAIYNRDGWAYAQRGVPLAEWPDSAHSLGTQKGIPAAPGRWNGHLVLVLRGGGQRALLDLSPRQFRRPQHGVVIPDVVGTLLRTPWTPQDPAELVVDDATETRILYRPMTPGDPDSRSWAESSDWNTEHITDDAHAAAEEVGAP